MSLDPVEIKKSKDGIVRITICFPKNDDTTLRIIDNTRGEQSRSQAIQRCLEYITTASTPDTLKSIMKTRHNQVN